MGDSLKDKAPWLIGVLLPALVNLNIFVGKAELAELRADIAEKYSPRSEVQQKLDAVQKTLDHIAERIEKLAERQARPPQG